MIGTIIITILVVILLQLLFLKVTSSSLKKVINEAINVSCYVNTYHYTESEYNRVQIGQETYYKSLFGDRESSYKRSLTDYIFWEFYTQIFNNLLNCIPMNVNQHNNRCLAEGEHRGTCTYLEEYQCKLENKYEKYCTEQEKQNRIDRYSCAAEYEKENDK